MKKGGLRQLATALMVVGSLAHSAPHASALTTVRQPPSTLAGVTHVRGSDAGSVLVRIPKRVFWSEHTAKSKVADRRPPFIAFGDGRLVGFVLAQQGTSGSERVVYAGWRAGRCLERGCTEYRGGVVGHFSVRNTRALPAGLYQLYLIADGARAHIRLEFPGLSGEIDITTRPSNRIDLRTLDPTITETPRGTLFQGFAATDMEGEGFPLHVMWVEGDAIEGVSEQCAYLEEKPHPSLYTPACPGSEQSTGMVHFGARSNYSSLWNQNLRLWNAVSGSYIIPTGEVKTVGMIAAWVQF